MPDLAKNTFKASCSKAAPPETTPECRGRDGSKGLMMTLLLHLSLRYFPQRKSFSFLCFYCKFCAARRKERKRPIQIERLRWGENQHMVVSVQIIPFTPTFHGSLCQRHPPV